MSKSYDAKDIKVLEGLDAACILARRGRKDFIIYYGK